jgi:hypothetical protein
MVVLPWSMWAMMPMFRMFCLWLIRRSMSVVCLKRVIGVCLCLCRVYYVECRKIFLLSGWRLSVCFLGAVRVSVWCLGFCFRVFSVRLHVV